MSHESASGALAAEKDELGNTRYSNLIQYSYIVYSNIIAIYIYIYFNYDIYIYICSSSSVRWIRTVLSVPLGTVGRSPRLDHAAEVA